MLTPGRIGAVSAGAHDGRAGAADAAEAIGAVRSRAPRAAAIVTAAVLVLDAIANVRDARAP
jgi:hypothetical protein